jgi:hypothetical protein
MRRSAAFVAACALAILAVVVYIATTSQRSRSRTAAVAPPAGTAKLITTVPSGPLILFRDLSPGNFYGRLALVQLPFGKDPARLIAPLSCDRVHYANGSGICMVTDESALPVRYFAYVFDRSFQERHRILLTGPPIRARVSPDGRRAALTVFEKGHSYADDAFSTRTIVVDTATGRQLGDLEAFAVNKDGAPFRSVDFNFWGVTFAQDGDRFFATLKTHGERYLVEGTIDGRQATVRRSGVECPSLSPDGTLIVFKKPLEHGVGWHLNVLNLTTGVEHPLNQVRRSVDDQVDWFDQSHVVYYDSAAEGTGAWILSVDGVTPTRLLLPYAYSSAVQR